MEMHPVKKWDMELSAEHQPEFEIIYAPKDSSFLIIYSNLLCIGSNLYEENFT